MTVPPIKEPSRYNENDANKGSVRRSSRPPERSFREILGEEERVRDQAKSARRKAVESEFPEVADEGDTVAQADEHPADVPVYNMRDKNKEAFKDPSGGNEHPSTPAFVKEAAAAAQSMPKETTQNILSPFDRYVKSTQKGSSNRTEAKESPFELYKSLTAKNSKTVEGEEEKTQEATPELSAAEGEGPLVKTDVLKSNMREGVIQREAAMRQEIAESGLASPTDRTATPEAKSKKKSAEDGAESKMSTDKDNASRVRGFETGAQIGSVGIGENKKEIEQLPPRTQLLKLIEQVVKELHNIEHQGRTDTIILLNDPPIFQNARIVISSFDSATKEFNLAFENLTGLAKNLLDANMNSLRDTLAQSGYVSAIHIITTTTVIETFLPGESQEKKDNQDKDPGEQRQQNKKR